MLASCADDHVTCQPGAAAVICNEAAVRQPHGNCYLDWLGPAARVPVTHAPSLEVESNC